MKKLFLCVFFFVFFFSLSGVALSVQYTYSDQYTTNLSIDISGGPSPVWIPLHFPHSTQGEYGINGVFEYDAFVNAVSWLTITLHGKDDIYPSEAIDFYLDFDSNHSSYSSKIASYRVNNNGAPFTLTLDIKNNELDYNGVKVGSLSGVGLNSFVGLDAFWVGYDCHFTHTMTDVNVGVSTTHAPEPGTLVLLGSALFGLVSLRRKFRN